MMEQELAEARKEIAGLKATHERLQKEATNLERKLRDGEQREKRLEEDNRVLMNELSKAKENGDKKKVGDDWIQLLAREQLISAEMEAEARRWRMKSEADQIELEELRRMVKEYQAHEEEMKSREAESRAEQQMVYAEIKELRTSVENIIALKEHHRVEAAQAQEQIKKLNSEKIELQNKLQSQKGGNEEAAALHKAKEDLEALYADAMMQLNELRLEKTALASANKKLEEALRARDQEIQDMKEKLSVTEDDLKALKEAFRYEMQDHGLGSSVFVTRRDNA